MCTREAGQGGVPDPIEARIRDLWRVSPPNEQRAFSSPAFRALEQACFAAYAGMQGSRLSGQRDSDMTQRSHRDALENFFRWKGAPWYENPCPSPEETAIQLHAAYLMQRVERRFFAPLDQLALIDKDQESPDDEVRNLTFGHCEVTVLSSDEIKGRIAVRTLERFGGRHRFPADNMDGFFWLIVSDEEDAGRPWKRTWWSILDVDIDDVGRGPMHQSAFPPALEVALLVLLLCLKQDEPQDWFSEFEIPWVYQITDDPFSTPAVAPDHRKLHRQPVGDLGEEIEVADRSDYRDVDRQQLEAALVALWEQVDRMLQRVGTNEENLNPLTMHFFVKGFAEQGIDQLIANIFCLEATYLVGRDGRGALQNRIARLVRSRPVGRALNDANRLRDSYVHPAHGVPGKLDWDDLARIRWATVQAVKAYLDLAAMHERLDRKGLLEGISEGRLTLP